MKKLLIATVLLVWAYALGCGGAASAEEPLAHVVGNHPTIIEGFPNALEAPANMVLIMLVRLDLRNRIQLEKDLEAQHAGSKKPLTPEEFAANHGPLRSDFDAVEAWVRNSGFTITWENFSRIGARVNFSGTVAQADQVFRVEILILDTGAYGNAADPLIPARFQGVISIITGLDNFGAMTPSALRLPSTVGKGHASRANLVPTEPL